MKPDSFRDFVLEQLANVADVTCRAMFGGYGIYSRGVFFAVIASSRLYFNTNDTNRSDYETEGMKPFSIDGKVVLKNYYEVPIDILEDKDLLRLASATPCSEAYTGTKEGVRNHHV